MDAHKSGRTFFWVKERKIEGMLLRESEEEEIPVVERDQGSLVLRRQT